MMHVDQATTTGTPPAPPTKVAGAAGAAANATQAGGAPDAAKGVAQIAGGGGSSSLAAALDGVVAALRSLADSMTKLAVTGGGGGGCGMGASNVLGVQGTAAAASQFVARPVPVATNAGEDDEFEAKVLALINQERAAYGLAPVRYSVTLDAAAEKHTQHMSIVGRMAHDGIGDGDPGERIRAEGFRNAWGENVATGQTSPEQVVREWMASPLHRRNILDASFTQMGVGYTTASDGRSYWAQEFGA